MSLLETIRFASGSIANTTSYVHQDSTTNNPLHPSTAVDFDPAIDDAIEKFIEG